MHWETYRQLLNKTTQYEIVAMQGQRASLKRMERMIEKLGKRHTKK